MDIRALQTRLGVVSDGIAGPATYAAMFRAAGCRDATLAADMGRQAAKDFPRLNITTPLRLVHFLAQAAHETMGFLYLVELWGPTKAQARYDIRADLGNTVAVDGDGKLYRGRGIFHITGLTNYRKYGARIGVDLVANPQKAADPAIAVTLACLFWGDVKLNDYADRDDALAVSRGINTSGPRSGVTPNGLTDRLARLAALKKVFGC